MLFATGGSCGHVNSARYVPGSPGTAPGLVTELAALRSRPGSVVRCHALPSLRELARLCAWREQATRHGAVEAGDAPDRPRQQDQGQQAGQHRDRVSGEGVNWRSVHVHRACPQQMPDRLEQRHDPARPEQHGRGIGGQPGTGIGSQNGGYGPSSGGQRELQRVTERWWLLAPSQVGADCRPVCRLASGSRRPGLSGLGRTWVGEHDAVPGALGERGGSHFAGGGLECPQS